MTTNEELAVMIQNGERDKLPELWAQVERFVRRQAYRRINQAGGFGGTTWEDLYQSGYIALVSAADSYNPSQGMAFIGWLDLALKTAFAEAGGYRSRKQGRDPLHRTGSLDAPLSDDDHDGATLADVIPAPDDPIADAEERIYNKQLHEALDAALRQLPPNEEFVIRAHYYQGRSLREIGPQAATTAARALDHLRPPTISRELRKFIELRTPNYAHMGRGAINGLHTSAIELAVLLRERLAHSQALTEGSEAGL